MGDFNKSDTSGLSPHPPNFGVVSLRAVFLGTVLFLVLIYELPKAMGINPFPDLSGGTVGYADNVIMWISGPSVDVVKPLLESTADSVVAYMAANCLSLIPGKTQVQWVNSGKMSPCVPVCGSLALTC